MLYLIPTPIGNLGDISPRAIACLEEADFIAAEDTRVTLKLLNHFGIKKPLLPYHRHNTQSTGPQIIDRMLDDEICALVCDAGTPGISDPGEELVQLCVADDIEVIAIPGACALTTALSASGLSTGRFTFEGFLAMNKKNRKKHLEELRHETRTMIFYEAPHKLKDTLEDFQTTFGGDREIVLCRELTKKFEEYLRFTIAESIAYYEEENPRGEYVVILAGGEKEEVEEPTLEDGLIEVQARVLEGMSLRDAVKDVATEWNLSKNQLYKLANSVSEESDEEEESEEEES